MTTPVTDENVKFDGSLTPSIVVEDITEGFQIADFNGTALGANPTGLANDATVYTASVLVDDLPFASLGTSNLIDVTGSAAQTFTDLVTELNADLTGATASIGLDGNIRIESDATGDAGTLTNSSIKISDGDLFSSLTGFDGFEAPHEPGKDLFVVSHLPSQLDLDRFCTLINLYGGVLPIAPVAGLQTIDVGGAIAGGSATGLSADVDAAGSQTVDVGGGVAGGTATGLPNSSAIFTANVIIDGVTNRIDIVGSDAQTYADLVSELDADMTGATASVASGDLVVTSSSTGVNSKILIEDIALQTSTGFDPNFPTFGSPLFSSLTLFSAIDPAVDGTFEVAYVMDVEVDGVVNSVSVIGNAAQDYTDLLTEIDTDLTGATSAIVSGNVDITSGTTPTFVGEVSTIRITDGQVTNDSDPTVEPLLASLTDFVELEQPIDGVFDFRDALQKNTIFVNGRPDHTFSDFYREVERFTGLKPDEVFAGTPPNTLTYFDGTIFRFLFDDSPA